MAQNLMINGVTYNGVESLEIPNTDGDNIRYLPLPELSNPGAAENLLEGTQMIDGGGNVVDGAMPNNGDVSITFDGMTVTSVAIPRGFTSGGTVSLTDDIENEANTQADLITQIKEVLATKAGGGSGGGLPTGITGLATGEYTPAADQTCPITIPHGMSVTPNVVIMMIEGSVTTSAFAGYLFFYASAKLAVNTYVGAYIARYVLASGSIGAVGGNFSTMADIATETDIKIAGTRVLKGGQTYRWIAAAVDGL